MAILQRDLRASDHDREAAVAFLKAHYADGRLTDHELACALPTPPTAPSASSELARLTSDLPAAPRAAAGAGARRSCRSALLVLALALGW